MENRVECQLIGTDGNIFALVSRASSALDKAGYKKEASEMRNRVLKAKSYGEALEIIYEYVEEPGDEEREDWGEEDEEEDYGFYHTENVDRDEDDDDGEAS